MLCKELLLQLQKCCGHLAGVDGDGKKIGVGIGFQSGNKVDDGRGHPPDVYGKNQTDGFRITAEIFFAMRTDGDQLCLMQKSADAAGRPEGVACARVEIERRFHQGSDLSARL